MWIEVVSRRSGSEVKDGAVRVYIGRPSPLGNPYQIGQQGSRAEVIEQYEQWLKNELRGGGMVRKELERLARIAAEHPLELECWCKPLACHGDVLKRVIEQMTQQAATGAKSGKEQS
jgi:hypothetical protein